MLQRCQCASLCSRRSCLEVGWATFCTSGVFLLLQWAVCSPLAVTAPLSLCSYTKGTPFSLYKERVQEDLERQSCASWQPLLQLVPSCPEMEGRKGEGGRGGEGIRGLGNSAALCSSLSLPPLRPCPRALESLYLPVCSLAWWRTDNLVTKATQKISRSCQSPHLIHQATCWVPADSRDIAGWVLRTRTYQVAWCFCVLNFIDIKFMFHLLYLLGFTHKWKPTVFFFLCLTYCTTYNTVWVHPCCCKWQHFHSFLWLSNVP